jgi:hypothetical protein
VRRRRQSDCEVMERNGEASEMTRRRRPCVGEGASEVVPWRRGAEVDGDWEWGVAAAS